MVSHGLILITALMTTLLAMPLVTRFAHTLGLVDQPDARKVHTASMPRSGGIAIALGFFVTLLLFWFSDPGVQGVMLGALIIIITGICDDLWQISPKQKFAGEILAAIAFVWWSGASLHTLGDLFGIGMLDLGIFSYVITVVGIVGVINAVNLSDGLDGLAGGLSAMACLFLGFFAYVSQQWNSLFILVALSGSLLGFLYYNAHPARVFMGDTGSLLIGFLLSATAVLMAGTQDQVHTIAPISMALILALPIADTLIVMIRRLTLGVSPFAPDKTHLHHRLLDLGIPHGAVVSILYTVMGVFGLTAVMMRGLPEWLQLIAGAGLVIGVYGSVILMGRLDYSWFNDTSKPAGLKGASALNKVLFFNRLTAWSGRSIPWVTWLIPLLLVVPVGFLSELPAQAKWLLVLSVVGLLALYPLQWTQERVGIMHGLLYWYVFLLLGIFSCYGTVEIRLYLAAISVFIGLWVAVKLVFKPNRQVFLTSGFEVLLIMVSWLLPSLLMKASFLDATTQQHLMIACLESIPFLIAMKIIIRRQHQRNRSLTINLALILVIVIVSSMLSIY